MAEEKKNIEQPSEDAEKSLISLLRDDKSEVSIGKDRYRIGSLKKGTRVKVSEIVLEERMRKEKKDSEDSKSEDSEDSKDLKEAEFEGKVMAKIAAAYLLNSWWTLRFLGGVVWAIYWRWLHYVKEYTDADYLPLMILCKKKAEKQTASYSNNITLATDMKMTTMMMTRKEVRRILQEHTGVQPGAVQ